MDLFGPSNTLSEILMEIRFHLNQQAKDSVIRNVDGDDIIVDLLERLLEGLVGL